MTTDQNELRTTDPKRIEERWWEGAGGKKRNNEVEREREREREKKRKKEKGEEEAGRVSKKSRWMEITKIVEKCGKKRNDKEFARREGN